MELRYTDDTLRLRIRDNGPGPLTAATHGGGHGLAGMRERAAAADGEMRTGPAPGGGFLIEATLPAKGERPHEHPASRVRIIVADDHHLVRTGFAALLGTQPDFRVIGTACDGAEAVRLCRELSPDVVLMDVRMPGMGSIEATRQLARTGPGGPRILILTTFDLDGYVYDALRAGASGFLLKDVTAERLFDAVRLIAGDALLAPAVTRRLISDFTRLRPPPDAPSAAVLAELTPRETQVLRLIAAGLCNLETAARLVVTEETVKTHVSHILSKLGLRNRAVGRAHEEGRFPIRRVSRFYGG